MVQFTVCTRSFFDEYEIEKTILILDSDGFFNFTMVEVASVKKTQSRFLLISFNSIASSILIRFNIKYMLIRPYSESQSYIAMD